jgi:uncharacterized membrane protein
MIYFVFAQNMRIFLGWTQRPSLWYEWTFIGAESPTSLPFKIVMNPLGAWRSLTFDGFAKIAFLLMFLIPAGFLPLFGIPALLPAFPYLFLSMFSSYSGYYNIESHYGAFLLPFFFVALLHGTVKLEKSPRFRVSASKIAKIILLLSAISLITILPGTYSKNIGSNSRDEHIRILYETMKMIPQNASVLTQNDLFPHVSSRVDAYTIPSPMWAKEYRQVAIGELRNLTKIKIDYVLVDLNGDLYSASGGKLILEEFIYKQDCYNTIVDEDGVRLFKLRI